jgi:curved DNA-binding protein CbpA
MPDFFALLSLPPSAALDEDQLQQAYLSATRLAHPDQTGGDLMLSVDLNAAQETLKSPVTRLKHLVEQHSQTAWRAVPLESGLMSLFEKLGPLLQWGTQFLARKQAATSALAKALLSSEEMRLRESLEGLNAEIEVLWQQLESALPACDRRIAQADPDVWSDLQALQAKFSYLAKWRLQIREKLLSLMLSA